MQSRCLCIAFARSLSKDFRCKYFEHASSFFDLRVYVEAVILSKCSRRTRLYTLFFKAFTWVTHSSMYEAECICHSRAYFTRPLSFQNLRTFFWISLSLFHLFFSGEFSSSSSLELDSLAISSPLSSSSTT